MASQKTQLKRLLDRSRVTCEYLYFRLFQNRLFPPKPLEAQEQLQVFLKSKKRDFDPDKKIVSAYAFMPSVYNQRHEKSSFVRRRCQTEADIWRLGHLWTTVNPYPRPSGTNPILGRAVFQVSHLAICSLRGEIDPSPHPDHAVLLGWSGSEPQDLGIAHKLALRAETIIAPKQKKT